MAEDFDSHLNRLGGSANPRGSSSRLSTGRNSIVSEASASRNSLRNVTEAINLGSVDEEISDTRRSLLDIEQEIQDVENRRSRRLSVGTSAAGSLGGTDQVTEYYIKHARPKTFKPYFTLGFLCVCSIMFVVSIASNGWAVEDVQLNPLIGPGVDTLINLGAKETDLIQDGDWWRLLSPMVLHVGMVHLLANMLGLVIIGIPMEQEFGSARIALVAISSGIFGVVMSALFAPHLVGVGASGVIYGLFGAAWADLVQNWEIYRGRNKTILIQLSVYTVFNFLLGLMPYLDNWAHFGGFICGLIVGLVVLVKSYGEMGEFRHKHTYQIVLSFLAAIGLPVFLGIMTFLLFVGSVDFVETCNFCSYISCVPMPPGASGEDLWWDCTECSNGRGDYSNFEQGLGVTVSCPDAEEDVFAVVPPDVTEEEFDREFILYCKSICERSVGVVVANSTSAPTSSPTSAPTSSPL
eukprot:CAMPEP_0184042526 /NCGR_PEP_ID=MMETSP0955-20130417/66393_1 /TAXON_ID=627963 /ORGANISM="Aplanochytrium sp, Strain PBS07" /LENGTH=464 /DNA_ID=CAMNT_0026333295 /DNA_START=198 /DNA_END=1592 /DNA_ORIENTATION=+